MQRRAHIFYFLAVMVFNVPGLCSGEPTTAFKPGEKLKYRFYIAEYPAGEANFTVKPMATIHSRPAYHFVMTAQTSPVLDALLMIGDRVESYADEAMTHALLYKEHKGGASYHDITVTFDWMKNEAQCSLGGKKYGPTALMPGAFDPLSAIYALRHLELKGKRKITMPVSKGLRCIVTRANVLGKQKVRIESRDYDTYLIELLLEEFSDLFKGATVRLWITSDASRLPVRIVCEFPVGRVMAELES